MWNLLNLFREEENYGSAFCLRCQVKRPIKNGKRVTLKNDRPAVQGNCPECNTKMSRIEGRLVT